jgi:outer membrane protein TolC
MIWQLAVVSLALFASEAHGTLRFSDVANRIFSDSDLKSQIESDRIRVFLEYQVAVGNQFDPVLKAKYFDQFRGDYIQRRKELSVAQRLSVWGSAIEFGYNKSQGDFADYDGKYMTQDGGSLRAKLDLPLLRNGWTDGLRAALRKGIISKEVSELQARSQSLDLLRQTGARYWDWYLNGQRLKVAEKILKLAETRQEKIRIRVERGDIAKIEELEGDRTILQRKSALAQGTRTFTRSRLDLEALLSTRAEVIPEFSLLEIPEISIPQNPQATSPGWKQSENEDAETHPEVRRQKLILEQTGIDRELAGNQFLPKLDFSIEAGENLGNPVYGLSKFRMNGGLFFEFPIPSRAATARISQAEAQWVKQEATASLTLIRIKNQISDSGIALGLAMERLQLASSELELAKKLVDLESKRFLEGDSNLLLLNIREQNLAEAEIRKAFRTARQGSPCILFFDEIDALVTNR